MNQQIQKQLNEKVQKNLKDKIDDAETWYKTGVAHNKLFINWLNGKEHND